MGSILTEYRRLYASLSTDTAIPFKTLKNSLAASAESDTRSRTTVIKYQQADLTKYGRYTLTHKQNPSAPLPPRTQIQIQARTPMARASSMRSRIPPRNPVLPPHRSAPLALQRLAQPKALYERTGVESTVRSQHSHERSIQKSILLLQRFKTLETGVDSSSGSVGVGAG
jgi:hypothetical protein